MASRVIAVAGAKGSPGCSFLAMALARCLGESQVSTLLVDADAEGGGLAPLLDIAPADVAGDRIDEPTIRIDQQLWFAELGQGVEDGIDGLEWTTEARRRYDAVVVDLGHTFGTFQRQLSAGSDWLLWVVVPDRSGLQRADLALSSGILGAAKAGIVFNRVRRGCLAGAEEALSGRHHISVVGRVNEDRRIATRLMHGLPVHRLWGLKRTLRNVATSVHPGVGARTQGWL
jgi:MinD-like ATPase involved in chromosome partitioning or flagellar assembly